MGCGRRRWGARLVVQEIGRKAICKTLGNRKILRIICRRRSAELVVANKDSENQGKGMKGAQVYV